MVNISVKMVDVEGDTSFGKSYKDGGSNIVTGKEMFENTITEIPMLWDPFLPKQGLALLAGDSDNGKSTLARQFSIAVVSGEDQYLGLSLNAEKRSVIYVCTEDDRTTISSRIKNEYTDLSSTEPLLNLRYIFDDNEIDHKVRDELIRHPADCVIIDALGDVISDDSNNMTSVRNFYRPYKALAEMYDCLFLFIHHNRKSAGKNPGKNDVSGSQAFEAKPRAVLMLNEAGGDIDNREICMVKGNFISAELKKTKLSVRINDHGVFELLERSSSGLGFASAIAKDNDRITDLIIRSYNNKIPIAEIINLVKAKGGTTSRTSIYRILKEKGIT